MKKIFTLPFIVMIFFSCQKEMSVDTFSNNGGNNNTPAPLEGTWNFLNFYANFSSTAVGKESGVDIKIVSACETTSINNKGNISFTSDKFTSSNIAYSISDTAYFTTYIMGIPQDKQDFQVKGDVPAYSASKTYQKIGNDSLYFPNGSAFQGLEIDGQQITTSAASGAKYTIKSDTLLIYANINAGKDSTISQNGLSIKFRVEEKATTILTFKKK
ncbi:MAG: hypothetical protein IT249_05370 [Chitinophagaceae bacterium]|nr:hypothetical protein [Chitinophagaceae bacterium]